jgi:hypothetical protein
VVPAVFPDVEREMDMIGQLKLPENKLYKVLIIESILSIVVLLAAHYAKGLVSATTYIAFIICLIMHIQLKDNPNYSAINLTFLAASGVLPFFFSQIGFNFNFIFYAISGIIILKHLDFKSKPVLLILLMLMFMYVNSIFSSLSSFTTSNNNSSIFTILFPISIFIFIVSTLKTITDVKKMYLSIFIAVVVSSIDFVLIYINGSLYDIISEDEDLINSFTKISGVSNQVNQLAEYIVFIVPVSVVIFSEFNNHLRQFGYLLIAFLSISLLFMSSRSGIALIVIYFLYKSALGKGISFSKKIGLIIILFAVTMISISYDLPIVKKLKLKGDTGDEIRIAKIDEALDVFEDYPILGVGLNNYTSYATIKYGNRFNTHNTLLSVISEQGIIGFILFMSLFFSPYINFNNNRKHYTKELKLINTGILESCTIVFLAFFTDHLHGSVVYFALISTAIMSTKILTSTTQGRQIIY